MVIQPSPAERVADALMQAKERGLEGLYDLQMARVLNLPWPDVTRKNYWQIRDNTRATIRNLMGDVVKFFVKKYSGWMVVRDTCNGFASVTNDPNRVVLSAVPRSRKADAADSRANDELEIVRRNSTNPTHHRLAANQEMIVKLKQEQKLLKAQAKKEAMEETH